MRAPRKSRPQCERNESFESGYRLNLDGDERLGWRGGSAAPLHRLAGGSDHWQRKKKSRPCPEPARDADVATKQTGELPGDTETKSGSARFPRCVLLELPEGLEHILDVRRVDPNAGVGDSYLEHAVAHRSSQAHLSLIRELHGVGEKVDE